MFSFCRSTLYYNDWKLCIKKSHDFDMLITDITIAATFQIFADTCYLKQEFSENICQLYIYNHLVGTCREGLDKTTLYSFIYQLYGIMDF